MKIFETDHEKARLEAEEAFERAKNAEDPKPETVMQHVFAPTPITEEAGTREPATEKKSLW
jgi:2-oxoisovalerate dehydrogenase E1 component